MKTARFWVSLGESYVRLTLRDGESLNHHQGGPTDEGWSHESNRWTFEDGLVRAQTSIDACDCDGRITYFYETVCPVANLAACPAYFDPDIRVPNWTVESINQRDYSAEAMGY